MMKTITFTIFLAVFFIISCSNEQSNDPNDLILGQWKLKSIAQQKSGVISTLQNGGVNFEFSKTKVKIDNDTYLNKKGTFNYSIKKENYFNPILEEPKNNVLIIDNQKFLIEINYTANNLIMTNYSDGRIIYHLEK